MNIVFEEEKTKLSSAGRSRSMKNVADAKLENTSLSADDFQVPCVRTIFCLYLDIHN